MKSIVGASLIVIGMFSPGIASEAPAIAFAPPKVSDNNQTPAKAKADQVPASTLAAELAASNSLRDLDSKITLLYNQTRERLALYPEIIKSLVKEHDAFMGYKQEAAYYGPKRLSELMETWISWLKTIDEPHPGFEGNWTSSSGNIKITPRLGGGYDVFATGTMPVTGEFNCELDGIGRIQGSKLVLFEEGSDDMDGWIVTLQRNGGVLYMDQRQNDKDRLHPDYCGAVNLLGGEYMPTRSDVVVVKAWQ